MKCYRKNGSDWNVEYAMAVHEALNEVLPKER
mgnify:CR=1 FL=1